MEGAAAGDEAVHREAACCVVGGGPAGAVLAFVLARAGVDVTLLEAHAGFDRDFRGDTLHPAILEALDDLGLAAALLRLPHVKVERFVLQAGREEVAFADFTRLRTRFPYVVTMPQAQLLEFLAAEASRCPCFRLELGARVEGLLLEDGVVRGVEYRQGGELRQLRATLTVGADGRFSMTRKLSGLDGGAAGRRPAMDVIWVRLPFSAVTPPSGATFRLGRGGLLVLMRHLAGWQAGLVIAKGSFPQWREAGIERLRDALAGLAPELAGSAASLHDWEQTSLLSVESSCLRRWHRPGLLLIGDAAHVVSPVGGVGINLAVQDALAAGRRLARPLLQGRVTSRDLAGVQRERVLPTRLVQACQALTERLVVRRAISPGASGRLPAWVRLLLRQPAAQRLAGELIAFAARPRRARAGGRTRPLPQPAGCHGRTRSLEGPLPAAHDGLG